MMQGRQEIEGFLRYFGQLCAIYGYISRFLGSFVTILHQFHGPPIYIFGAIYYSISSNLIQSFIKLSAKSSLRDDFMAII